MTENKSEPGDALEIIVGPTIIGTSTNQVVGQNGKWAGIVAESYDALDYRLMATFPASDAVAQY